MKTYGYDYVFALRASAVDAILADPPVSDGQLTLDGDAIAGNCHPGGVIPTGMRHAG